MALDATLGGQMALSQAGHASAAPGPGDARILVIKLADQLHNMRTLRHLPPPAQVRKSRQTLEILAPLARRLDLDAIRSELENLAGDALTRHGPAAATMSGRLLAA
jgi:HD domain-containing protein